MGDMIDARGFAADPVYIADMDRCEPGSVLSDRPAWRQWRKVGYATESFEGVMLIAGPETAAPEVTYPLDVTGWHAVTIGVYGDQVEDTQVLVRLSGESVSSMLMLKPLGYEQGEEEGKMKEVADPGIHEMFWKVADLTGQSISFAQQYWRVSQGDGPGSLKAHGARVAYVKLTPLSDDEVAALKADRADSGARTLFAHNDAHGPLYSYRITTAAGIRRQVEPYRDTDFGRLYWEVGAGDSLMYLSRIGRLPTHDGVEDFDRQGDRMFSEAWRSLREQGLDLLRVAVEHAHDIGIEIHASYRVAGFHFPPPLDRDSERGKFYLYHPELRGTDRNGKATPRLSYAYPEVRRFVVSLLSEIAGYDVDGVCLLYNRRPPLVEYEPPIVDGFIAEYGEDPRELDEADPRWLRYRAGVLTQFMREVREAMDDAGRRRGRPVGVSAIVMSTEQENLSVAMDLRAWIEEGLVDTIIPYSSGPNLDSMNPSWTDPSDLDFFLSITKDTGVRLAPNIMPRQMSPDEYRRRVYRLYAHGVENLFFWDSASQQRAHYTDSWSAMRRLGHVDEIAEWEASGGQPLEAPRMTLHRLGEWDLSYETPG